MINELTSSSPRKNPWKLGGLSITKLGKRVWNEVQMDDLFGRAAELAFYFFLGLFPALIFVTALIGQLPLQGVMPELMAYLRNFLPEDALTLVDGLIAEVKKGSSGSILSLSLLGALWASSSGLVAIMNTLNAVYDVEESRPFWKARLLAIVMTIGLALFTIVSVTVILYGETFSHWLAELLGFGWLFATFWSVLQWVLAVSLMLLAVGIVYYLAPNIEQEWLWVTPGSVVAVALWLAGSLGFKLYVDNFGNYNVAYGSLGGVVIVMLWFYVSSVVLLIGGEINAEIEKASPTTSSQT